MRRVVALRRPERRSGVGGWPQVRILGRSRNQGLVVPHLCDLRKRVDHQANDPSAEDARRTRPAVTLPPIHVKQRRDGYGRAGHDGW